LGLLGYRLACLPELQAGREEVSDELDLSLSLRCEGPWSTGYPKREPGWYIDLRSNEGYRALVDHAPITPDEAVKIAESIDSVLNLALTPQVRATNARVHAYLTRSVEQAQEAVARLERSKMRLADFVSASSPPSTHMSDGSPTDVDGREHTQ
jgi:hypothetical protein